MCFQSSLTWEAWTAIWTFALAFIGGITLLYVRGQLGAFRKESRIAHLIDLVNQFEIDPMATHRRTLGAIRAPEGHLLPLDVTDPPTELHGVMNFFEHMGYLLEGEYLDLAGVSIEFRYWILNVWIDAKKLVKYEQLEDSAYYQHFERMVEPRT
jgi:hypothetical protein